jgi:SPX domain protein involved in polyphosphate accumulation
MEATVLSGSTEHRQTSLTRYEFKYLIRPDLAEAVARFLTPYVEMDEHCRGSDTNAYTVKSIYFDSPDFECFHEKLGGQKFREKFRLRTYDHRGSAPLFLENKIKNGLAYSKDKVSLNARDSERQRFPLLTQVETPSGGVS